MKKLNEYIKYYTSARLMGADAILRRYLGIGKEYPVPYSLSHGVDMNHTKTIYDGNLIEPVHWAYNQDIYERSLNVKQAVKIPHPWLLIDHQLDKKKKHPTLVIGPPPGRVNDINLLNALKKNGIYSGHILLKKIKNLEDSEKFWSENGFNPVSAGWRDSGFYIRLSTILQEYEIIYSATLSSALFFAALVGTKCRLVRGYSHYHYQVLGFENNFDFNARPACIATKLLAENKDKEFIKLSEEILGINFMIGKKELLSVYLESLEKIKYPVYCNSNLSFLEKNIAPFVTRVFNRPGFCRIGFKGFCKKNKSLACAVQMNEIDIWLYGLNNSNFNIKTVSSIPGVTIPGYGVELESHLSLFNAH